MNKCKHKSKLHIINGNPLSIEGCMDCGKYFLIFEDSGIFIREKISSLMVSKILRHING